jgi:enoyl-CoA hydratase
MTPSLGVFCRRFGVPLIDGSTVRLPRIIGLGRALDLLLKGRPVRADEALAMSLVSRVVPRGEAREAAEELAREIARFPQACMKSDRQSVYEACALPFARALENELRRGMGALEAEGVEGAACRRLGDGQARHVRRAWVAASTGAPRNQ